MEMSERLQKLRKKAGYSQEQASEMLGLSRQAISKWESGQGKPDIESVIKLAEIYQVSADYILLGTEQNTVNLTSKKPKISAEYQKAISIIAIVAATAIITVLFITALWLLAKFVF